MNIIRNVILVAISWLEWLDCINPTKRLKRFTHIFPIFQPQRRERSWSLDEVTEKDINFRFDTGTSNFTSTNIVHKAAYKLLRLNRSEIEPASLRCTISLWNRISDVCMLRTHAVLKMRRRGLSSLRRPSQHSSCIQAEGSWVSAKTSWAKCLAQEVLACVRRDKSFLLWGWCRVCEKEVQ